MAEYEPSNFPAIKILQQCTFIDMTWNNRASSRGVFTIIEKKKKKKLGVFKLRIQVCELLVITWYMSRYRSIQHYLLIVYIFDIVCKLLQDSIIIWVEFESIVNIF